MNPRTQPAARTAKATKARAGTILIVVAGFSALLVSMTLAFLTHMRSDGEESQRLMQEIQARVMLTAGLQYIAETARIGWDDPKTQLHEEAFGWRDIRDGLPGPKDQEGKLLFAGNPLTGVGTVYPAVGAVVRCPIMVMRQPPFAVRMTAVYNPIPSDPSKPWRELLSGQNFDPQPQSDTWTEFATGDPRPRFNNGGSGWFRILRKGVSTFIITAGAGAIRGFRDWDDVVAANQQALFGSQDAFQAMLQSETVLWYEAEWNPAVSGNASPYQVSGSRHLQTLGSVAIENSDEQANSRQFAGHFLYIQRLFTAPPIW